MGEQAVDVDLAIDDEACAFRLADRGKSPGSNQRELAAEHVVADVERDLVALADEAADAPGPGGAHRALPRARRAGGIEGEICAAAVGELLDGGDGVVRRRVYGRGGAELLGARQ